MSFKAQILSNWNRQCRRNYETDTGSIGASIGTTLKEESSMAENVGCGAIQVSKTKQNRGV